MATTQNPSGSPGPSNTAGSSSFPSPANPGTPESPLNAFDATKAPSNTNFPTSLEEFVQHAPQFAQEYFNGFLIHAENQRDLEAKVAALNTTISDLQEKLSQSLLLVETFTKLAPQSQAPTDATAKAQNELARVTKIPDPDKYDGDRYRLDAFLAGLRIKLRELTEIYNRYGVPAAQATQKKLDYSYQLLTGKAAQHMQSSFSGPVCNLANEEEFIALLESFYGDPMAKQNAQHKLQDFKQGSRPFAEYHAAWQSLVAKAGLTIDQAFPQFRFGINDRLQEAFIMDPSVYENYATFVTKCNIVDASIRNLASSRARKAETTTTTNSTKPSPFNASKPQLMNPFQGQINAFSSRPQRDTNPFRQGSQQFNNENRQDASPFGQFGQSRPQQPTFGQHGFQPNHSSYSAPATSNRMQLDAFVTHDPITRRVTEEEMNRRMAKGLCRVCASAEHLKKDCPLLRQRTGLNQVRTQDHEFGDYSQGEGEGSGKAQS